MEKLIGGRAFTVSCNLSSNRKTVTQLFALLNTRANRFAFIDIRCTVTIAKFLGLPFERLKKLIAIKGYDGHRGKAVTHYLRCTFAIDNRRLVRVPFLVLDLGNYNLILSALWFTYFDVMPDLRRCRLR